MKLSDRVDALDGPVFSLELAILNEINPHRSTVPCYLTSLDAALTLFETIPDTIPSCPRKCVVQALRMKGL